MGAINRLYGSFWVGVEEGPEGHFDGEGARRRAWGNQGRARVPCPGPERAGRADGWGSNPLDAGAVQDGYHNFACLAPSSVPAAVTPA